MSFKAIINNMAKENNVAAQSVLQTYMLERLLERISISKYKDNFILKGGMLISAMLGIDSRTTMDMDTTIKGFPLTKDNITNIVVQGHTDSHTFAGLKTEDEQFAKNMELSLLRANAVADYAFKTNFDKKNSEKLRKMLVVEGKSFSEPILDENGKEDYAKSRRVEMKVRVKAKSFAKILGLNYGGD